MVIATQNPIEYEGTYPLPEAQLDRFMMRLSLGYPELADEAQDARRADAGDRSRARTGHGRATVRCSDRGRARRARELQRYVVASCATRARDRDSTWAPARAPASHSCAPPRRRPCCAGGTTSLPQDVKDLAPRVSATAIILAPEARTAGVDAALTSISRGGGARTRSPSNLTRARLDAWSVAGPGAVHRRLGVRDRCDALPPVAVGLALAPGRVAVGMGAPAPTGQSRWLRRRGRPSSSSSKASSRLPVRPGGGAPTAGRCPAGAVVVDSRGEGGLRRRRSRPSSAPGAPSAAGTRVASALRRGRYRARRGAELVIGDPFGLSADRPRAARARARSSGTRCRVQLDPSSRTPADSGRQAGSCTPAPHRGLRPALGPRPPAGRDPAPRPLALDGPAATADGEGAPGHTPRRGGGVPRCRRGGARRRQGTLLDLRDRAPARPGLDSAAARLGGPPVGPGRVRRPAGAHAGDVAGGRLARRARGARHRCSPTAGARWSRRSRTAAPGSTRPGCSSITTEITPQLEQRLSLVAGRREVALVWVDARSWNDRAPAVGGAGGHRARRSSAAAWPSSASAAATTSRACCRPASASPRPPPSQAVRA